MTEAEREELEKKKSDKLDKQMDNYWNQTGEPNQRRSRSRSSTT